MSNTHEHKLTVTDESGDALEVTTAPFDESSDWTDDTDAILATVRTVPDRHVNLSRADLRDLRDFLSGVLTRDEEENF